MAFFDVIKYEGSNDMLVFKHPITDFNTKATLIVHEKQEAIVFMHGEAKKLYSPGKYELKSDNLPGIKHIAALFSGGELANHCEVYFINKLLFANIPWVTSTMDIQDRTMENYHSFRAEGFFTVRISNSLDLFELIGTGDFFSVENLKEHFKNTITSIGREELSIAMNQKGRSYGEINSFLTELSSSVRRRIEPHFVKIGLILDDFRFEAVNIEKDETYQKEREHLGERSGQKIERHTYKEKRSFDVLEQQAKNQGGSGAAASAMAGIGFGAGVGQVYGGMVGNMANAAFPGQPMYGGGGETNGDWNAGIVQPHPVNQVPEKCCPKCHRPLQNDWRCCPYCGISVTAEQTCPNCGYNLPPEGNFRFCPNCSAQLSQNKREG